MMSETKKKTWKFSKLPNTWPVPSKSCQNEVESVPFNKGRKGRKPKSVPSSSGVSGQEKVERIWFLAVQRH